ncbi:hypothetical protein B0O80DRAFT_465577 [Mortierella sp. GBAus27b]|nr:hypothetical protein B0O80DRAFT_465577 [Mortierella sp. GBAus27b]
MQPSQQQQQQRASQQWEQQRWQSRRQPPEPLDFQGMQSSQKNPAPRSPLFAQWRDWELEQQYYQAPSLPRQLPGQSSQSRSQPPPPAQAQPPPQQDPYYPPRSYRESFYDDLSRYSNHPEPTYVGYDTRYRSPPLPPADMSSQSRSRPMLYGPVSHSQLSRPVRNYGGEYGVPVESSRARAYTAGAAGPGPSGPDPNLPVSRYAAPFLRDNELQQRESGRRRMSNVAKNPMGP